MDKALSEDVEANRRYEQSLEQTRWVISRVAELEKLVAKLRQQDVTIQKEMGLDAGFVGLRGSTAQIAGVGDRAASSGPLGYAMTPELPAATETAEQDDEDAWWGGESAWVAQDA